MSEDEENKRILRLMEFGRSLNSPVAISKVAREIIKRKTKNAKHRDTIQEDR